MLFQTLSIHFGKLASLQLHSFTPREVLLNWPYLASLSCLALQAAVWPQVLRRFPLIWAYLCMSSVQVAIPVLAYFYFHEQVTQANALGSVAIAVGVLVLLSDSRETRLV